jgi:SagB-type dehydrogenase family enzyme
MFSGCQLNPTCCKINHLQIHWRIIMNTKSSHAARWGLAMLFAFSTLVSAQGLKPIQLPKPPMDGGKPLMQALKERKSTRSFSTDKLPMQTLGSLLWAAFGINRPDSGHRTAPSAVNWQEIDIYVATADGLYLYEAKGHTLQPVLAEDLRAKTGMQPFLKDAPVELVYVADYSRMGRGTGEEKNLYSAADTGFIGENVYLYCSSEGLATVVRGSVDRPALAKAMKLRPEQKIILAQTVGYPGK